MGARSFDARRSAAVLACCVAAATGALALTPARGMAAPRDRACSWVLEPTADRENILFPDITTRYLGAVAPVPPGGYVEIKGEFPHGRYMSLQTYSTTLQSLTVVHDEQIRPDPGSSNPYVPGARRDVKRRSYTVRLLGGRPPAHPPANTLYDTSPDGKQSGRGLAYRLYLPDRGSGPFGGVPAPALTMVLASGQRIPVPTCPDLLPDSGLTTALAGAGLSKYYLPEAGLLAYRSPVWHRYVNAPAGYGTGFTDSELVSPALGNAVAQITGTLPSGLGENADNKYVYAYVSQEFGEVVAFHARLPTTPRTYEGERRMGAGQLRYWSMCTGDRTTQTWGCVVDKDVPLDRRRDYTLVMSTAADRPANAVAACGVAWLPWGPDPKGIVLMRNMLPAASFARAIQRSRPGTERTTLGPYYPAGRYYATPEDFERTGCHAPARAG